MESVCVLGLGYVGLPTASVLATRGLRVTGVDINPHVVATVNRGSIHITEPGLEDVVRGAVKAGRLVAAEKPVEADAFIIAVPTPFKGKHVPDVSYVESATRALAPYLRPGNLVVLESTSPVGTSEQIAAWLASIRKDLSFPGFERKGKGRVHVAHCPERVLPGQVLKELVENDRIIGGIDEASTAAAVALYQQYVTGTIHRTNARTAEMSKLVENAFRDVNIAFANELSLLCEKAGIDVWELIEMANHHPRVKILKPGPGVGGHCIAVDPWFIVDAFPKEARLIHTARQVNDDKPRYVGSKIRAAAKKQKRPVIACLGLSYKPDIDDLRESPALHIVEALAKDQVGDLIVVEPHIDRLPKSLAGKKSVRLEAADRALKEANVVAMLVDHTKFRGIPRDLLKGKEVIDTRGFWR